MPEAGVCPACRAAQLPRAGVPLCAACTEAARQPVPQPTWVFDSPLLRRAMAQANLAAVPAIIRAASGMSRSDLAAIVGWTRGAIGLYERGQRSGVFDIRVLLQFADAVGMPREALLPLVLGDVDASPVIQGAGEVDRRTFGGITAGLAAAAIVPAPAARVGASHVKYLRASVDSMWLRDETVGGSALLPTAMRQLHRVRRMLKESSYTGATGRQFLSASGWLADMSGWLAFDAADLSLAAKLYAEALEYAAGADDQYLTAWVLAHQSGLSSYQALSSGTAAGTARRVAFARQALQQADRAAEEARYEHAPRLHSVIALRRAYAASVLGDVAAHKSALARAHREISRERGTGEPLWLSTSESTISEEVARGALNLGEPARAEEIYRDLLEAPLTPLSRAWFGARLAVSLQRQGAQREAAEAGTLVLAMVDGGVSSARTLRELRPVRLAARRAGDDEFCARFNASQRALAGETSAE